MQQQGETFDDFLIALGELVKTCKFCSEDCAKKNIRDQIIEGLNDGDTVEDLLQIANLTLTTTITKCQSREAARRHHSNMSVQDPGMVAALRRPSQTSRQATPTTTETCPGCGARTHRGGHRQCPAYNQVCSHCHKIGHFARVCRGRQIQPRDDTTTSVWQPSTNTIRVQSQPDNMTQQLQLYNMSDSKTEPAPTIMVSISSSTGTKNIKVLLDSGADISAAGQDIMRYLGHHKSNLVPSRITPRTVNGS